MNGTVTIAQAGPYPYTSRITATLVGYARCSTDRQTWQPSDRPSRSVASPRTHLQRSRPHRRHSCPSRPRPGLRRRAPGRLLGRAQTRRLARSVPDARAVADQLRERGARPALDPTLYDPSDPMGKMFYNILVTFAELEADFTRMRSIEGMYIARAKEKCAASNPNCPTDSSGHSAACTPPASSPNPSPSQDQPSIARSTVSSPLSVRSCPLPESTSTRRDVRPGSSRYQTGPRPPPGRRWT